MTPKCSVNVVQQSCIRVKPTSCTCLSEAMSQVEGGEGEELS